MSYQEMLAGLVAFLLVVGAYLAHDQIKTGVKKIKEALKSNPKQNPIEEVETAIKRISDRLEYLEISTIPDPRVIVHRELRTVDMVVRGLATSNATEALLQLAKVFRIASSETEARLAVAKIIIDGVDRTGHTCGVKIKKDSVVEIWLR